MVGCAPISRLRRLPAGPTKSPLHGNNCLAPHTLRARRGAAGVGASRPLLRRPRHGGARSSPAIEGRGRKEGRVREQKVAGPPAAARRGARVRRVRWGAAAARRRRRRSPRQRRGRRQHLPPLLLRARWEPNRQPISRPSVRAHTPAFSFLPAAPPMTGPLPAPFQLNGRHGCGCCRFVLATIGSLLHRVPRSCLR